MPDSLPDAMVEPKALELKDTTLTVPATTVAKTKVVVSCQFCGDHMLKSQAKIQLRPLFPGNDNYRWVPHPY